MARLIRNIVAMGFAFGIAGCSETPPLPTTNPDSISLTAAHLQSREVPATPIAGQNYIYCLGCLSLTFMKELIFTVNPPPVLSVSDSAVVTPFITDVNFVSGALPVGVITATSSISVNSHS